MKLQTKQNNYIASNNELSMNEDMTNIRAYSYGWWQYVATDSVGNLIFNNFLYSNSTSKHQSNTRNILARLAVNMDLELKYTSKNLCDGIKPAMRDEIRHLIMRIREFQRAIAKKGSWKAKNAERLENILEMKYRIKDLRRILVHNIDKAPIPHKNRHLNELDDGYKKYFLKPNGKLQSNEFQALVNKEPWGSAPESMDRLTELLDLKQAHIQRALAYYYIADLENMVAPIDTPEYAQLKRWLKSNSITRETLNTLALDKMHTYLVNKMNRKEYAPSEPKAFPIADNIAKLDGVEDLRLIKNDRELKAEGRAQSHCIGTKHYIDACLRGFHALNYKGYTFFLTPDGQIRQTNGRHNSYTPESIKNELIELIAA